jgi:hypothetical protein
MGLADRIELGAQRGVDRRGLGLGGVDEQMHLLAGGDQRLVALAVQPMKHVEPLLVEREHLGGRI